MKETREVENYFYFSMFSTGWLYSIQFHSFTYFSKATPSVMLLLRGYFFLELGCYFSGDSLISLDRRLILTSNKQHSSLKIQVSFIKFNYHLSIC
jgi:hypothetical protein